MSVDLDDARRSAGHGERRLGLRRRLWRLGLRRLRRRQPRQGIAVYLAREIVFARRRRPAMEAHPYAQQRIGEAVPLLTRRHEIDVLEPRQIVLGRSRRALQTLG